jgi:hypothetical protein
MAAMGGEGSDDHSRSGNRRNCCAVLNSEPGSRNSIFLSRGGPRPQSTGAMFKTVVVAACVLSSPAFAGECAHFGEMVTLTGRYVLDVLAAPSAGVRDPRRDAGRTANLLYLVSPLCVAGDDLSEGIPAATDLQVLCPNLSAGSGTAVTGRLFGAHAGNGQTPILLVCPSYNLPPPLRTLPAHGGSV